MMDDGQKISPSYTWFGGEYLPDMERFEKQIIPVKVRATFITACDDKEWPQDRLASFNSPNTDLLGFLCHRQCPL